MDWYVKNPPHLVQSFDNWCYDLFLVFKGTIFLSIEDFPVHRNSKPFAAYRHGKDVYVNLCVSPSLYDPLPVQFQEYSTEAGTQDI